MPRSYRNTLAIGYADARVLESVCDGASYSIRTPDALKRLLGGSRWVTMEPVVRGVVALGRNGRWEAFGMTGEKRQLRVEGGRTKRVNVRMTPEDEIRLSAAAEKARMSLPAYLIDAGLRGGGFDTPNDRDSAIYEVIKLERQVARVGNNVNQIAHRLNALDEIDPGMKEAARDVRQAMRIVQEVGRQVARMGER